MRIEQPQHLTRLIGQKTFPLVLAMGVKSAVLLSGIAITILIFQASKGKDPDAFRWMMAVSLGPVTAAAIVILHAKVGHRRRYLELRNDGVHLGNRGLICWNRILEWTTNPWPDNDRVTCFTIRFKMGFGRQRWSMLLDDPEQIAKLQERFTDLSRAAR